MTFRSSSNARAKPNTSAQAEPFEITSQGEAIPEDEYFSRPSLNTRSKNNPSYIPVSLGSTLTKRQREKQKQTATPTDQSEVEDHAESSRAAQQPQISISSAVGSTSQIVAQEETPEQPQTPEDLGPQPGPSTLPQIPVSQPTIVPPPVVQPVVLQPSAIQPTQLQNTTFPKPLIPPKPNVMTTVPTGTGVANFKVPRSWDNNAPKFTTDDAEDLRDFIDQVDEISSLAKITNDQEKKKLLTSYLPSKKKTMWRDLGTYSQGTYADFLKEVYKCYPEIKQETEGTLKELERLCAKYKGIPLHDEGKLKRFGMEFTSLIKKLSMEPAIILNKEACQRYLNTLDLSFSNTLRSSISARNMFKEEIKKIKGTSTVTAAPTAGGSSTTGLKTVVDHRKEDPILLKDLIEMAEQMAATGVEGTNWGESEPSPARRPSSVFSMIKLDKNDERLEELSGEIAGLKDSLAVQLKESQAELLKIFQGQLKDLRDTPPHMSTGRSEETKGAPLEVNQPSPDRFRGPDKFDRGRNRDVCFYCEQSDHFSRDCPIKIAHIAKGWVQVEEGITKLGGGGSMPRGRGPASVRIEEYWSKKPRSQNMYSVDNFYNGEEDDELGGVKDELRTLRARLNHVEEVHTARVVQPTYSTQAHPGYMALALPPVQSINQVATQPATPFDEFAKAMYKLVHGEQSQDQFVTTRGGKDSGPSTQGF